MADFCRKYKLPQHRFSRWKHAFLMINKEGYKKKWVKVCDANEQMVNEIKAHTGTKPRADRLTLDQFSLKHNVKMDYLTKVFHRLQMEEVNGKVYLLDTRKNLILLKFGRIIRR